MRKLFSIFMVAVILVLTGVASAKIITGWQPSYRTSLDMQVAIYGKYGYQPPITNVYGNEQVNIVDSWSQWYYGDYASWIRVEQTGTTEGGITVIGYEDENDEEESDSEES